MSVQKIYKTKNIVKVDPEETLTHALALLSSSHDSAFVIDKQNEFLGVINPYYCIIKKSYPSNTKVKHCLTHPPKISIDYSLKRVIKLMNESKIHYLPVFEHDKFKGIITARRILTAAKESKELQVSISSFLKSRHSLISVYEKDLISHAIQLFKKFKVSKLVVIADDLKLKGILAYYDLIASLATPKDTKQSILKQPVSKSMKTTILTLTPKHTLADAANLILTKKIGSVVIVDKMKHPIGIITTRDLLNTYIKDTPRPSIQVVTKKLSKNSSEMFQVLVAQLSKRLSRDKDGKKSQVKIVVEEKEQGGIYKAIVSVITRDHITVIKREGKNLLKLLNSIRIKKRGK